MPTPDPTFGRDFVIPSAEIAAPAFFADSAEWGGEVVVQTHPVGELFANWDEFVVTLGPNVPPPEQAVRPGEFRPPPEAAESAAWRCVREWIGPAAWERPGVYVEFLPENQAVVIRHTMAVHEKFRALVEALTTAESAIVRVETALVAVRPGVLGAFETLRPLPMHGTLAAVMNRADAAEFERRLTQHDAGEFLSRTEIRLLPGRDATMQIVRRRQYVRHYDPAITTPPADAAEAQTGGGVRFRSAVAVDQRGFLIRLRAVPMPTASTESAMDGESEQVALAFAVEWGAAVPFVSYPLNGGALTALHPQGHAQRILDSAAVDVGHTLVVLLPDAVPDEHGPRLLLVMFAPSIIAAAPEND